MSRTARACLYGVPFLLVTAGRYIAKLLLTQHEERQLAVRAFLHAVVMQVIGGYF